MEASINASAGWQTLTLTADYDASSGQIMFISYTNSEIFEYRYLSSVGLRAMATSTSYANPLPDPFGAHSTNAAQYSIYAKYV